MITPYSEFLERRERRQRVTAALAQPVAAVPGATDEVEQPAPTAAERPSPNPHGDANGANGFRTLERAT